MWPRLSQLRAAGRTGPGGRRQAALPFCALSPERLSFHRSPFFFFFFYVMQVLRRVLVTGRDVQGREARTGRAGAEMKGAVPRAEGVGRPRPGKERGSPNQHVHSSQGTFAEFNASSKCRYGLCMRRIFISSFSCTANFIMHIHLRSILPNR